MIKLSAANHRAGQKVLIRGAQCKVIRVGADGEREYLRLEDGAEIILRRSEQKALEDQYLLTSAAALALHRHQPRAQHHPPVGLEHFWPDDDVGQTSTASSSLDG